MFRFLLCFCLAIILSVNFSFSAENKAKKIYMVHWVKEGRLVCGETFIKYFKEKHPEVEIIEREAMQDPKKLVEFREEIKKIRPDVVYVYSTTAVLALAGPHDKVDPAVHITDIPIITVGQSTPVESKVAPKIGSATGRNVSGVGQYVSPDISYKIMKEYKPEIKKVVILFNKREDNSKAAADAFKSEANKQKIECEFVNFEIKPGDNKTALVEGSIERTVVSILEKKPDIIFMTSDTLNTNLNGEIIENLAKNKHMHAAPIYTTLELQLTKPKSCMFGLFTSFNVMGLMAAAKADEILFQGKKIQDIPYEVGSQMSLVIRKDTMSSLKTYPALSLLETADILE